MHFLAFPKKITQIFGKKTPAISHFNFPEKNTQIFVNFSGDVNALPYRGKRQPYSLLTSIMTDSLVDKYPDASWHPWFATFGNKYNTYSSEFTPERIDYLMYWASPEVAMCTSNFTMPMYNTHNEKGDIVSLSDHEALSAEFLIEKRRKKHSKKDSRPIMAKLAKNQRRKRLFYTKRT